MLGKLRPPYPAEFCAAHDCRRSLSEENGGAFLFKNLQNDKLCIFCADCAMHVELHCREQFMLVAL